MRNRFIILSVLLGNLFLALAFNVHVEAQNNSCAVDIPEVESVMDLQWSIFDEEVLISTGHSFTSPHLHTWLKWNIRTGEIEPYGHPTTVIAVALSARLNLTQLQLSPEYFWGEGYISVSPNHRNAIYFLTTDNLNQLHHVVDLEALDTATDLGYNLGTSIESIDWYGDDQFIVSTLWDTSIEAGFQIIHGCLNNLCETTMIAPYATHSDRSSIVKLPYLDRDRGLLVFIDEELSVYDLETRTTTELDSIPRFSFTGSPITIPTVDGLVLIGYTFLGTSRRDFGVYLVDPITQELTLLQLIDGYPPNQNIHDWLYAPSSNMVIYTSGSFYSSELGAVCF